MSAIASQVTSLPILYSTGYSGADQRKYQSSASLAFAWNSPVTGEFPAQMASNAKNVSILWRHHVGNVQVISYHTLRTCDFLFMPGLKFIHVSERGQWRLLVLSSALCSARKFEENETMHFTGFTLDLMYQYRISLIYHLSKALVLAWMLAYTFTIYPEYTNTHLQHIPNTQTPVVCLFVRL